MNRRELLNDKIFKLIFLHGLLLLIFIVIRVFFLINFSDSQTAASLRDNFFSVFINSLRFDTVVSLYGFALLFLLSLLLLILPNSFIKKYENFLQITFKYYSLFVILLFVIISTLDFFYYKTYGNHFDSLIFALKNDDTAAIFNVFWTDYPLIRIVLFWVVTAFIIKLVISKILHIKNFISIKSPLVNYFALSLFLGLYFIGLRGSLGMFPLKLKHAYVTDNLLLNKMTINSVFALKSVLSKGDNKNRINTNYAKSLQDNGFDNIEDALMIHNNYTVKNKDIANLFFKTTKKNQFLEENPPNVVFILMESFDRHFFDLHSSKCNTLGSLEKELDDCLVYKNILSSGNITITTLENLLVGAPFSPIGQSQYKEIPLSTAINIPFKNANYTTNFLYSGEYVWRNIGYYAKTQGFDTVITQKNLEKEYPNAETNPWGVHDVYLYNKIYKILEESKSPQFIFSVTISNHTPYVLPKEYDLKPIHLSDSILNKMKTNKELSYKSVKAYQYAADQLGKFIYQIKNSNFGENTIIMATGDHNSHQGFNYTESEEFYAHTTPIILYIPDKYKKNLTIDLEKFGSHKDLFPTLFNLSLSKAKYFNTGENLFTKESSYSINGFNFAANKYGAVKKGKPTKYYQWQDNSAYLLETGSKNMYLDTLQQKMNAYNAIMYYKIQKELGQKK